MNKRMDMRKKMHMCVLCKVSKYTPIYTDDEKARNLIERSLHYFGDRAK